MPLPSGRGFFFFIETFLDDEQVMTGVMIIILLCRIIGFV